MSVSLESKDYTPRSELLINKCAFLRFNNCFVNETNIEYIHANENY